jgi:hypothetical protein
LPGLRGMPDHHPMRNIERFVLAAAGLLVLGVAAAGEAAPAERPLLQPPKFSIPSPITDRFAIRGMFYRPAVGTTVRYDNAEAGTAGTLISAEDTLGLADSRNQGWVDMMFRLTPRHRIQARYYQQTRHGTALLNQTVLFGEETFTPADGQIRSAIDMRQLDLSYTYSLLRREKMELGLGVGLHLLQFEGSISAPLRFETETLDAAGPFPTLNASAIWRITRRFSLNADANFLTGSTDQVEARYEAYNADVQFRMQRNLAVGLGYSRTRYKTISVDPDFFPGYFVLSHKGPQFFLRASF